MTIWEKVNSGLIYNKKYLKAEKRFNTKEGSQCIYISVILIASVYIKDKNYYPQLFLEKCECCQKKRDVIFFY